MTIRTLSASAGRALIGLVLIGLLGLAGLIVADQMRRPEAISAAISAAFAEQRLGDANGFEYDNGRELSHFSECIGLSTAIAGGEEPPVWFSLASPALLWAPPAPMCQSLRDEAAGAPSSRYYAYSRYWHGYRLVTEPVLSHFSYAALQGVCATLLALAGLAFGLTTLRRLGAGLTLAAAAGILITTETGFLYRTPTHAISLAVLLFGAALANTLTTRRHAPGLPGLAAVCFLIGAAYNYFDFLYNPDLLMFLIGQAFLVGRVDIAEAVTLRRAMQLQAVTIAGYCAMWAQKWLLVLAGGLIVGNGDWFPADHLNRWLAGGEHGYVPLAATLALLRQSVATPGSAVLMAFCAAGLVAVLVAAARHGKARAVTALAGLWLLPLAVLEIKAGHTIMHAPFTWRIVPWASVMTLAAATRLIWPGQTTGVAVRPDAGAGPGTR